ncbi:class I SAM-dependent methyltransferase [Cellulosimicrobium terreum]|nr:class I SAM-dependent methyltransferase [Cellulosimicrobium terreum]
MGIADQFRRAATAPSRLLALRREVPELRRQLAAERKRVVDLTGRVRAARSRIERKDAAIASQKAEIVRLRAKVREIEAVSATDALPDEVVRRITGVTQEHLSYLQVPQLAALAAVALEAEAQGVPGLFIEAGTARGGSAIVIAAAKSPERRLKVYDVFGMIPPPSDEDGDDVHRRYEKITAGAARGVGGETYYGYRDDLLSEVTESFARHGLPVDGSGVDLVQGYFEDTIHLDEPVALAHLDGDWYESTRTCLERIVPHLVVGGRLVVDDYFAWSGCRKAVDEYFASRTDFRRELHGRLHLIRV